MFLLRKHFVFVTLLFIVSYLVFLFYLYLVKEKGKACHPGQPETEEYRPGETLHFCANEFCIKDKRNSHQATLYNIPQNNFELNTYSVCLSPYFGTKLHPKEHLKEILGQWVSSHHKGHGLNFLSILMDRIWRLFISLHWRETRNTAI